MGVKRILGNIQPYNANIFHGRFLLLASFDTATLAQRCRKGASTPSRGHEQVKRTIGAAIRDLNGQDLLSTAKGRVVWNGPIQSSQTQEAGNHPRGLPKRQFEQYLDRKAKLDGSIGEYRWSTRTPSLGGMPYHVLVEPPSHRCKQRLPGNGSTEIHAASALRSRTSSSSCGSGQVRACSCPAS